MTWRQRRELALAGDLSAFDRAGEYVVAYRTRRSFERNIDYRTGWQSSDHGIYVCPTAEEVRYRIPGEPVVRVSVLPADLVFESGGWRATRLWVCGEAP